MDTSCIQRVLSSPAPRHYDWTVHGRKAFGRHRYCTIWEILAWQSSLVSLSCTMETVQFTGQSRFGVKMKEEKKNPFFLSSIVFWSSSPVSTQNSPQFFCVSLSPSYLSFQIGFRWLDRSIPHAITKRKVRNSQSSSIQYIQELKLFTLV